MKIHLPSVEGVFKCIGNIRVLVAALVAMALLTGCLTQPIRSGKLDTPVFSALEIPLPTASGWATFSTSSSTAEVLPTRGRAVRVWFYAPVGSAFSVSLSALDGTQTVLAQNYGTPTLPEEGYFQIANENVGLNPPLYTMYVRAPLSLTDPANFDILIVNKSLRTDVSDSEPLVEPLRQRKVFTVTVQVKGNGHVTSTPPGIQCGTTFTGQVMSVCSYEFGSGQVRLYPGTNDLNTTKFLGWSGNCDPSVQVCQFTLDGTAPVSATATFVARANPTPASTCPPAPLLPGLRWVDLPSCAYGVKDQHPGITDPAVCDAAGYFCCEPGGPNSNSPRCGGGKIESPAGCLHLAPTGTLRQPGGCYEVNP